MNTKNIAVLLFSLTVLAMTACGEKKPPGTKTAKEQASESTKSAAASPMLVASIHNLMKYEIDPAANFLWNSVSTDSNEDGLVEHKPRTDEDWMIVRNQTIKLIEAANLLMMPGRKVVEDSEQLADAELQGNLSAAEIQNLIDKDPTSFAAFARSLQLATQDTVRAIEARNTDALFEAVGPIDTACEACHQVYWYPDQPGYDQ
jgi:predicted small lipoprotein YifL